MEQQVTDRWKGLSTDAADEFAPVVLLNQAWPQVERELGRSVWFLEYWAQSEWSGTPMSWLLHGRQVSFRRLCSTENV